MSNLFDDTIMLHGWPECGPGSLGVEELYAAFKERLITELGQSLSPEVEGAKK